MDTERILVQVVDTVSVGDNMKKEELTRITVEPVSSVLNVCVCDKCDDWIPRLKKLLKSQTNILLHYVDKEETIRRMTPKMMKKIFK